MLDWQTTQYLPMILRILIAQNILMIKISSQAMRLYYTHKYALQMKDMLIIQHLYMNKELRFHVVVISDLPQLTVRKWTIRNHALSEVKYKFPSIRINGFMCLRSFEIYYSRYSLKHQDKLYHCIQMLLSLNVQWTHLT